MSTDCRPDRCAQLDVAQIFRWHSPSRCPARSAIESIERGLDDVALGHTSRRDDLLEEPTDSATDPRTTTETTRSESAETHCKTEDAQIRSARIALKHYGWGSLTAEERVSLAKTGIGPTEAGVSQRTLNAWRRRT